MSEPEKQSHELSVRPEDSLPEERVIHGTVGKIITRDVASGDAHLAELIAMHSCYEALVILDEDARCRALTWLAESLEITGVRLGSQVLAYPLLDTMASRQEQDGPESVPTPREFMARKKPQSQAERIACLAYYLARYRDLQHFRPTDIAAVNTEAAGQKFGNLSRDIDNTDRHSGYIVSAGKGVKQITTRGEAVVEALPDREAVKLALHDEPYRAKRQSAIAKKTTAPQEDEQ